MAKIMSLTLILVLSFVLSAFAHHPTEDMIDSELFEMIDDMVGDTPHGDMEEDDFGVTITGITVEDADDLIQDGLLDAASVLDGEVTITISFPEEEESIFKSIEELENISGIGMKTIEKNRDKISL